MRIIYKDGGSLNCTEIKIDGAIVYADDVYMVDVAEIESICDDEAEQGGDDFFEIVHEYKTTDGSEYVNQIDTAWSEAAARKIADNTAAYWEYNDESRNGRIAVIRYANAGTIYEKEVE